MARGRQNRSRPGRGRTRRPRRTGNFLKIPATIVTDKQGGATSYLSIAAKDVTGYLQDGSVVTNVFEGRVAKTAYFIAQALDDKQWFNYHGRLTTRGFRSVTQDFAHETTVRVNWRSSNDADKIRGFWIVRYIVP